MSRPKVAVYSPNGSISKHDSSHRAAWPKMVLDSHRITDYVLQPEDPLANYEEIWLYLGMEFTGSLNLFGGASDENAARLLRLLEARAFSYLAAANEAACPLLGSIAKARAKGKVGEKWADAPWGLLDDACMQAKVIGQGSHPNAVVGDSHALSLYDGQSVIYRHDHKTLHGALTDGLASFYPSYDHLFKRVTLCFGNIDLQHHLVRVGGGTAAIELAGEYIDQAAQLNHDVVEIMELLPVVEESRKIATPGYYRGKPWHGSWAERNELRTLFNRTLLEQAHEHEHLKIVSWPEYIFNHDGSFNQAYQERSRGVHLSWEHRRQSWPA
jgi:hypothetical protein